LKKAITILLLIVLAGQASVYYYEHTHEVSLLKEIEEKAEKNKDVKKDKEYVPSSLVFDLELFIQEPFTTYCIDPSLHPVLDNLTRPPDKEHLTV
jgi:hypothetical protein